MNSQVNVRFPDNLLDSAKEYAASSGYGTVQDFIRETVREKVFEDKEMTSQEKQLIKTLIKATKENNLYGTEEELFAKLNR
jgi:Arc/MetJ-type ribon-helix-helix transcriptional regulator